METRTQSHQFLRKRKFLLVLPLLVLPFLTLLFWAIGGGSTSDLQAQQNASKQGFNMELPNANLKDEKPLDKLSYYEKAASDSAKLNQLIKNDPYYLQKSSVETTDLIINDSIPTSIKYAQKSYGRSNLNTSSYSAHRDPDPNEAKVYNKLEQLNSAMSQVSMASPRTSWERSNSHRGVSTSMNSSDIERLEQMMTMNKEDDGNEDPEMKQLNGMMEKILDLQHPERVKDRIRQTSQANKGQVFAVDVKRNSDFNSLLIKDVSASSPKPNNRFYSLEEDISETENCGNAISAVIHQSQVLVDGSIVKLRLLTDVFINGRLVPKDSFVFGTASLNGERLLIKINRIRYNNSLSV